MSELACFYCDKQCETFCIPCAEVFVTEAIRKRQSGELGYYTCPACGTKSQAWFTGVCDDCIDTSDGKAVLNAWKINWAV